MEFYEFLALTIKRDELGKKPNDFEGAKKAARRVSNSRRGRSWTDLLHIIERDESPASTNPFLVNKLIREWRTVCW